VIDVGGGNFGVSIPSLKGIVVDNKLAKLTGTWTSGANLDHIGPDYVYARGAGHTATFPFTVPADGRYEVRFATSRMRTVRATPLSSSATPPAPLLLP